MYERCCYDDAAALEEEGEGESAASLGVEVACRCEEDAADEESYDGDQGFEPAIRMGDWLSRNTEGEEDRVACELLDGILEIEGEYVPVCMLTKQLHALYALESQSPETIQVEMTGISA